MKMTDIHHHENWNGNSLQPISSLPSIQLGKPLHRENDEMHSPLEHLNWSDVQSVHRKLQCSNNITRDVANYYIRMDGIEKSNKSQLSTVIETNTCKLQNTVIN